MTTAINFAISPFAQPKTEPNANAIRFLDIKLSSVPTSDIPEEFRKLSRRRNFISAALVTIVVNQVES